MADALETLKKLRIALATMREAVLRNGIWPEGLRQKAYLAELFESSLVVDIAGNQIRVRATSRKHTLWKIRNNLDARRLHMTNTLQRAFHAPQSFIRTEAGFTISVPRANFLARIPGRAGGPGTGHRARKPVARFLNTYFRFANLRAYERIGKLGLKQIKKVKQAGMKAGQKHLAKVLGLAIKVRGGIARVNLELGKLGLEKV